MPDEMFKKKADGALQHLSARAVTSTDDEAAKARRKWIKAGIIGLPVILTLKSKPAWADDTGYPSGGS